MVKKNGFVLLMLLLLCVVSVQAKEYSFKLMPVSEEYDYYYKVRYDAASKKFSLSKDYDTSLGFLFLLDTDSKPEEFIFKNHPNVEIYHSSKTKNWGGNANELIFADRSGKVLFGVYIDPVKFNKDNRRKSYILTRVNNRIVKVIGCATLRKNYEPVDELLGISKSLGKDGSISSYNTSDQISSLRLKDYICKIYGTLDPKRISKMKWEDIPAAIYSASGKVPEEYIITSSYRRYTIKTPGFKILGITPADVEVWRSINSLIGVDYNYHIKRFPLNEVAEANKLAEELREAVDRALGRFLKPCEGKEPYVRYIGTYEDNGLEYSIQTYSNKWGENEIVVGLSISIFF